MNIQDISDRDLLVLYADTEAQLLNSQKNLKTLQEEWLRRVKEEKEKHLDNAKTNRLESGE